MFKDINNGHTCYCENCLKLQTEIDELKKRVETYKIKLKKIKRMLGLCEYGSCLDCDFKDCDDCTSECRKEILRILEEQ